MHKFGTLIFVSVLAVFTQNAGAQTPQSGTIVEIIGDINRQSDEVCPQTSARLRCVDEHGSLIREAKEIDLEVTRAVAHAAAGHTDEANKIMDEASKRLTRLFGDLDKLRTKKDF